jgi:hypothetical protein
MLRFRGILYCDRKQDDYFVFCNFYQLLSFHFLRIQMIARLDNEVIFKKAFTDPFVFRAFVKDILGIDVNPPVIETEHSFSPRLGSVDIRYDIFAEDPEKRVIVEIQKVEYDHNFERFLHYHLQAISEQVRSSKDYRAERTVYTIVVITAPYKVGTKSGEFVPDEVLVSKLNPKNLQGVERDLFNHELVFLCMKVFTIRNLHA